MACLACRTRGPGHRTREELGDRTVVDIAAESVRRADGCQKMVFAGVQSARHTYVCVIVEVFDGRHLQAKVGIRTVGMA